MKKGISIGLILLFSCCVFGIYAQETPNRNIYVKTFPIIKVLTHELGYVVKYNKLNMSLGTIYLPLSWFSGAGGRCELFWGRDNTYPFLSIYWLDGKFSHIKIFLQDDMGHPSWGSIRQSYNEMREKFNVDPETFKIEF